VKKFFTARLKQAQAALHVRFRSRITLAGAAYMLAIALVASAAFLSGNNLLFLILATMISALLVSGFIGRLGLAGLELDLLLPQHTAALRTIRAKVRLRNVKRWMPSFSIHLAFSREPDGPSEPVLYFPLIPGGATIEEPVELYFPRRGSYKQRTFEFSTRFPFGFAERREAVVIRHDIVVYPCLDPKPGFERLLADISEAVSTMEPGTGEDFYRIRPYEPSESARHLDWKATAHTGTLQTREFARRRDQRVTIYLDIDVPLEKSAWFETAIECAAFLAFELAEQRIRLRFQTQGFEVTLADSGDIYTILRYLALVSPRRGKPDEVPDDNSFQIVFSQFPERLRELGWCRANSSAYRLLGPEFTGS
jgi:uncharacterized protein (DUF58 family)